MPISKLFLLNYLLVWHSNDFNIEPLGICMRQLSFILLCFISTQALSETVENPNQRKVEYNEISKLIDFATNKARSPFIKYVAKIVIKDESKQISDLKLWISHGDEVVHKVSIAEDGVLDLPVYNQEQAENTWLNINQPKDTVSISMSFEFNIGNRIEVSYYDLFILLDDFNDFMSEMAGMASWLMSDMDAMKFVFDKPATIEFNTKKKHYRYKTNKDNEIVIDVRRKLFKENPLVKFSISPKGMTPED